MNEDWSPEDENRVECAICRVSSRHRILAKCEHDVVFHWESEPNDWSEKNFKYQWELLQCEGCEYVVSRVTWQDNDFGGVGEIDYVPRLPTTEPPTRSKNPYRKLPEVLRSLYGQVIDAFNSHMNTLCAIGTRMLLEGICADKNIVQGPNQSDKLVSTLEGKINGLKQFVPEPTVDVLHGIRFLGNQVAHELGEIEREDVELALDVMEDVLNIVYELDYKGKLLLERIEERKMKKWRDALKGNGHSNPPSSPPDRQIPP